MGRGRAGEASVASGTSPVDGSKQAKQTPIRDRVVGGCQGSGVISPRACCSPMSSWVVAGQVAMADSV